MSNPTTGSTQLNEALAAFNSADFERAERLYKKIEPSASNSNHDDYLLAFDRICQIQLMKGEYGLALNNLGKTLAFKEQLFGPDHPEVLATLRRLAELHALLDHKHEAQSHFLRAYAGWLDLLNHSTNPGDGEQLDFEAIYSQKNSDEYARELYEQCKAHAQIKFIGDEPFVARVMYEMASIHFAQGHRERASKFFTFAISELDAGGYQVSELSARSHHALAQIEQRSGKTFGAEAKLLQAMSVYQQIRSADHPDIARVALDLAEAALMEDRLDDALSLTQQANFMLSESLGDNSPHASRAFNLLASLEEKQEQFLKAEMFKRRSLSILETLFEDTHDKIINYRIHLARLLMKQEKYDEAEPLLYQAIDKSGSLVGEQPLAVADLFADLAKIYIAQARFAKAESVLQKEIRLRDRHLIMGHPDQARTLLTLGEVNSDWGKYQDAEVNLRRAIEIVERDPKEKEGPLHAKLLAALIKLTIRRGKYSDAEKLAKQRLEICLTGKGAGTTQPELSGTTPPGFLGAPADFDATKCYIDLAKASVLQYKLTNAEKQISVALNNPDLAPEVKANLLTISGDIALMRNDSVKSNSAYAQAQQMLHPKHMFLVHAMRRVASVAESMGRANETENSLLEAKELTEKFWQSYPSLQVQVVRHLAGFLQRANRKQEAYEQYKAAVNLCERRLGASHPELAITYWRQAEWFEQNAEHNQAAQHFMKAIRIMDSVLGNSHPEHIAILIAYSHVYWESDAQTAESLLQRAVTTGKQNLGAYDPSTQTAQAELAHYFETHGDNGSAKQLKDSLAISWEQASGDQKKLMPRVQELLHGSKDNESLLAKIGFTEPRLLLLQ